MNTLRITEWPKRRRDQLDPPGCVTEYISSFTDDLGCLIAGIVYEHRFAFYYWGLYSLDEAKPRHPVLITLDSHDDVGVPSEVDQEGLDNLNIRDQNELGLFAWKRLRSLNDGHILPALYLDFFSDVYVLINDNEQSIGFELPGAEQYKDRYGDLHMVRFYQCAEELLTDLPPNIPVFLDIDLDFFTKGYRGAGHVVGSELLKSDAEISSTLSIDGPLIGPIVHRIAGLTIALEQKFCGGLQNSLHILGILDRELFEGTLSTHSCHWKKRDCPQRAATRTALLPGSALPQSAECRRSVRIRRH